MRYCVASRRRSLGSAGTVIGGQTGDSAMQEEIRSVSLRGRMRLPHGLRAVMVRLFRSGES